MKRFLSTICICYFVFVSVLPAHAKDWPNQFRDASNRNSVNEQPVLPLTKVGEVNNQLIRPLVEGNILITAESSSSGQRIVAYRLSTLTKLWQFPLGTLAPRQPVIHRGAVYFGVFTQPNIYALSLTTGDLKWQRTLAGETVGVKFAPLGVDDNLYVVGKALHHLSAADGLERWSMSVIIDSPLAADDRFLYIRRHDQRLTQVDLETGAVIWSVHTGTTFGTTPVVTGSTVYLGTYQKILAIEKSSGAKRWEYATASPLIGTLAAAGTVVFFSTNAGDITTLNDTGHLKWTNRFNSESYNGNGWQSDFLVAGDAVLAQADEAHYLVLNALTGAQIFHGQLTGTSAKFQAIVDQKILVGTDSKTALYTADSWLVGAFGDPISEKRIDPVVVVPGILESWPVNGVWRLDPVFKMFDNLLNTLRAAGYSDDLTLFTFPYDWHKDNTETAQLLAQKIAAIRAATGSEKVDIVAHSMGGLVARVYLQSSGYRGDVDQLISIAVPHHGAVKSYLTWEAGEVGGGLVDSLQEKLIDYEAFKKGYHNNSTGYIRDKVPSMGQLLPIFDYLERDGQLTSYFPCSNEQHPCNPFLELLNSQVDNLISRVSVYNIIGQLRSNTTLEHLIVDGSAISDLWSHGMPKNYPSQEGLIRGLGDNSVLSASAHLDGVPEKTIESDHVSVVTDAASLVVKELSDKNVVITPKVAPLRYLFVRLFSPITMLLTDKEGRKTGTDPLSGATINDIPDAYYSGKTEDGEFAIIPDPVDDDYDLSLTGTASGEYSVTGTLVEPDSTSESTQTGTTEVAKTSQYNVVVKPQEVRLEPAATPTPCVSPATVTIYAP